MIFFSVHRDNVEQVGLPNIYFPMIFTTKAITDNIFDLAKSRLVLPYNASVHICWQVFVYLGAANYPKPAVFGAKIIKNPVASTNPNDAGWAGDWKQASIGTYGSQPGWMTTCGSCTDEGQMNDEYGLFAFVTPENTNPIRIHGHKCHTWMHGFIY